MSESDVVSRDKEDKSWQLKALTEALGELTLTVKDSLSVGRGTDNDVVLGSKEVSRNHALLSVLNGKLYVKDLASSNGTFVNDERITSNESTSLQANDNIRFASFSFDVMMPVNGSETETDADTVHSVHTDILDTDILDTGIFDTSNSEPYTDIEKLSAGVTNTDSVSEPINSVPVKPVIVENSMVEDTMMEEDTMIENEEVAAKSAALLAQDSQPVVKSTIINEVLASSNNDDTIDNSLESLSTESFGTDTISVSGTENTELDNRAAAMPIAASLATESTVSTMPPSIMSEEETVMSSEIPKQPLVEELPIKEPVVSDPAVSKPTVSEPIASEPIVSETMTDAPVTNEALMHDKAGHQESVVSPEHDKTTTTALQEEADPDVLRAKQAATSQFSGTANLGAGRDLGTEGNNAMDQAIDNPANAGHPDKKPSGSWFIWVFIALIIIGIALWLFNMGGA